MRIREFCKKGPIIFYKNEKEGRRWKKIRGDLNAGGKLFLIH
jgi:hypothetical protein